VLATLVRFKDRNHYAVLGVSSAASHEEITAAYLSLMRRFHPDSFRGPAEPEILSAVRAIFARVSKAYEVLGHRESRARYDGPSQSSARSV
jgi:curved DNA-binding protein CbpA